MKITLTRTGGFTGITLTKTIDTSKLPKEKKEEIEKDLLFTIDHLPLKVSAPTLPDQFTYHLSVQDGIKNQEITLHENDLTEDMRQLINYLQNS